MSTIFKVPSIACEGCALTITKAIKEQYPNLQVEIELESKEVIIEDSTNFETVKSLIESSGYPVLVID